MKNLKVFIYLFIATGILLVSCSKDSNKELETSVNESTQLITATDAQQAPDLAKIEAELLNFDKTAAFKESAKNETATSRNALPFRVQRTIDTEYPNASMLSFEEYISIPNRDFKHYSVFLDNGMEVVVFQWGHLLANATIEKEYEPTELQAGELDWDIMLRLYHYYTNDEKIIEEIEPSSQVDLFDIDFKDGSRIVVNRGGQVVATGQDIDGDDDGDGTGLPTLPGGDDNSTSGNGDDDDDGLGDNDDGVSGNQDDDDDGDGDNDDGVSSNNDDDDDGDGDNDDGINGNSDDDDDGNGDDDDGIANNSTGDDDDDGNNDNDDGVAGNSDDDDDGNGDNDDGISGNSDDDDDGNGDNDDGASGNSNHINPASLPASIRNYIAANYPNATIIEAEQYSNRYEVELNNGVELYFDLNGNLINTSGNNGSDNDDDGASGNSNHINPASLPASIRNYIAANYPNATIIEAEQYSNRYEVELNNGVELYFDLNGNLTGTSSSGSDNDDDDDNGSSGSDNDDDDDNGSSGSDNDDDDDNGSSDNDDDDDNGSSDNDDDDN